MNFFQSSLRGVAVSGLFVAAFANAASAGPQLSVAQEALLLADYAPAEGHFGQSIDISGDRAVVGAAADRPISGTAYVLNKNVATGEWSRGQKLVPPGDSISPLDQFGQDVAIEGSFIAVGAPWAEGAGDTSGAVFIYELVGGQWVFDQELHNPTGDAFGRFGAELDMCGDWLVVGAWNADATAEDSGVAHVFARLGGSWIHTQTLEPQFAIEDENFGAAIDCHGSRVAIGAPGFPAGNSTGAVYVYELGLNAWQLEQQLTGPNTTGMGSSVAIVGSHVLAGAPGEDGEGSDRGAVYYFREGAVAYTFRQVIFGQNDDELFGRSIGMSREDPVEPSSPLRAVIGAYRYDAAGVVRGRAAFMRLDPISNFVLDESVESSEPSDWGRFGYAAALEGRSALISEVGAEETFVNEGAVHCYERGQTSWDPTGTLRAIEHDLFEEFGSAVSMSGNVAVIGMPGDNDTVEAAGGAVVYERAGSQWIPTTKLSAESDAETDDRFGSSVATDGTTIVIGAPFASDVTANVGVAYVFRLDGQGKWKREARLVASAQAFEARFGTSVSVSGDRVVVGAPLENGNLADTGAAYVFERDANGDWPEVARLRELAGSPASHAGTEVALDGDHLAVGAPGFLGDRGIILTYYRDASGWNYGSAISTPEIGLGSRFGDGLALDGTVLAIGAWGDDGARGSVYLFERTGTDYSFTERLLRTSGAPSDDFGWDVDLDGDVLIVGARRASAGLSNAGSASVYRRSGPLWIESQLAPNGLSAHDFFGSAVAASDDEVMIGAVGHDVQGLSSAGAVHLFSVGEANAIQSIGFGDGSWGACPCGNESAPGAGEGCANSTGLGSRLQYEGSPVISANDLSLHANNMPPGMPVQLFAGTEFADALPFGNGLRFTGGQLVRLAVKVSSASGEASWDDLSILSGWLPGETRYFQVFYRDVGGPCGSSANLSSGLQVLNVAP